MIDPKPFAEREPYLEDAIQTLEAYLPLFPTDENSGFVTLQLRNLRSLIVDERKIFSGAPDPIYRANKVINKARLLYRPTPEYTKDARQAHEVGIVRLIAVIGIDGRVRNIIVVRSLGHGLNAKAVAAAEGLEFTPAQLDGHPVPQYLTIEYQFAIF
jgi:TonB family protein